jgi:hypothetical protein
MSFAGSAQRLWNLTRYHVNAWVKAPIYFGVILLIVVVWAVVLCWYCIFGLWLVPYRLIRRGQRKRRMQDLRHKEMLTMMHEMGTREPPGKHRAALPPPEG